MLDPARCRDCQRRLLDVMRRRDLDAVVVGRREHVYYLSGHWPFWQHESAFVLNADGWSLLFTADAPAADVAADEVRAFEATRFGTQRQEQSAVLAGQIAPLINNHQRVGFDASSVNASLADPIERPSREPIDADFFQLRRVKDADELALMKRAIECTRAMYERARQIIEPGIPELRVLAEMYATAVTSAGEPLAPGHLDNDFRSGAPGGPPRGGRVATAGELYVLDLGPAYRGYYADNCRTIAVDRRPTDAQVRAWESVRGVLALVERLAKPGVRCRDLFDAADQQLRSAAGSGLTHHLGHGVGLQLNEFPHLNPRWDDVLMEGEIFTCEPGLYAPELAAGVRLENQYLVTPDSVMNLTPFPLELAIA